MREALLVVLLIHGSAAFSPAFLKHQPLQGIPKMHYAARAPQVARGPKMSTTGSSVAGTISGDKVGLEASPETSRQGFAFTKQWYPLAVADFLDSERPHSMQLMGNDLVLWKNPKTQKWSAFKDACPHRLAPLSEGRVEPDGTLMCAYHAWRFDEDGKCTSIPHVPKHKEADFKAVSNACATQYPLQEAQGLLWVWGEPGGPGSDAAIESALRPPALIPELLDTTLKGRVQATTWNVRDLPYGWDFFVENVLDPAHVTVSHHGLTGNRYTQQPIVVTPKAEPSEGSLFSWSVHSDTENATAATNSVDYSPPGLVRIRSEYRDGGQWVLILYATPSSPGWTRHIGCQVLIKDRNGKLPAGVAFFALPMPVWLNHVLTSFFLHQDLVFLHHQEQTLADRGYLAACDRTASYLDHVFLPGTQDRAVRDFRQWLQKTAGGIPWAKGRDALPPRVRNKGELFDVYNTHTKNCRHCSQALVNLKRVRTALFAAAFVAVAVLNGLAAVGVGGVLALAGLALNRFMQLFYVYEFEHADND